MYPLRFILVFFSAVLAGYFAWRTVRSSPDTDVASDKYALEDKSPTRKDFSFKEVRFFFIFPLFLGYGEVYLEQSEGREQRRGRRSRRALRTSVLNNRLAQICTILSSLFS
ncbi:hypothetical protein QN277_004999 [Acacia crassicarpa]|uniref:Uncharacterized protein n=1 Tax=Acacia crassicarpa TaxID=499986 RepID=A0AAE1IVI7_9FABA|nr:hypothetical protein QN277_004999 [Acacia crassicarpa]